MKSLAAQRCNNHASREAVARCPGCQRFFCRECISDHEGRVICATCLAAMTVAPAKRHSNRLGGISGLFGAMGAILLIWVVFYLFGAALSAIPTSFHNGTIWNSTRSEKP
jgi:hypothetical protein